MSPGFVQILKLSKIAIRGFSRDDILILGAWDRGDLPATTCGVFEKPLDWEQGTNAMMGRPSN